jgi:Heme NO binding associated.
MDKLKSSIEEANQAVDQERETNVSLLHMIFPPDIAKRLWLGEFHLVRCRYFLWLGVSFD